MFVCPNNSAVHQPVQACTYWIHVCISSLCRIFIFIVIILVHKYYINNTLIWITLHCTKYNQKLLTKQKVSWPSISCVVRTKVFCHLRYIKIRNTAIETRTTYVVDNVLCTCAICTRIKVISLVPSFSALI